MQEIITCAKKNHVLFNGACIVSVNTRVNDIRYYHANYFFYFSSIGNNLLISASSGCAPYSHISNASAYFA
jgi:hypothetical protein